MAAHARSALERGIAREAAGDVAVYVAADLDGDGDVGASDLSLFLAAWGGC